MRSPVTEVAGMATGAVGILTAALLAIATPVQAGVPTPRVREVGDPPKQFARIT